MLPSPTAKPTDAIRNVSRDDQLTGAPAVVCIVMGVNSCCAFLAIVLGDRQVHPVGGLVASIVSSIGLSLKSSRLSQSI